MSKHKSTQPLLMELDELLSCPPLGSGGPTDARVREFWEKDGEFHQEHYLVAAIERHLLTAEQRATIGSRGLSIEKMLNGRYGSADEPLVIAIFSVWNAKLNCRAFGS